MDVTSDLDEGSFHGRIEDVRCDDDELIWVFVGYRFVADDVGCFGWSVCDVAAAHCDDLFEIANFLNIVDSICAQEEQAAVSKGHVFIVLCPENRSFINLQKIAIIKLKFMFSFAENSPD